MVLKLYGSAMSTARVLVTILEKELEFEYIPIDMAKGEQTTEAYKQLQPFGKVPVLADDGFRIFESRAICKYLARVKGLGPPDEVRVAQAEAAFDTTFAIYDRILAKQKYLAGDELTLVDLFHLPNASALKAHGYQHVFDKYPNVDKWFTGLQERETWIKATALTG
ncbi:glutathione S-transferase [Arthroderma uncinatum]|uniref:glutathione S-transferase n=1 Tax=Arthroderma uncinatum TaxID=74035 RepID=UPI00144AE255|nr:glutathione S-transferase [Arthroderma uncinatum]KAF3490484.1 glutathione S-transferase [Arthroderma uncinatum]